MSDARWLDADAAAAYLSVRVHELPRLLRAGKLPPPSMHLGPRSPRYDRLALDAAFSGAPVSDKTGEAVANAVQEIIARHQNRPQNHGGRQREDIPLPAG